MSTKLNNRRDNLLTKINNILGMGNNSSVGRINYWDPTIPDPRFDPTKKGPQYEQLPDGTLVRDGVIISEDAPTGWLGIPRVFTGAYDALPWTKGALDKRGSGLDKWGRRIDAPGTLGGVPIQIFAEKKNPDYDESKTYSPREERDEWCLVGLLGQIPITKGQPVASNWIKMKDVSDTVEMYFVK